MTEAERADRPRDVRDLASIDRAKVHPQVRAAAEWAWRLLLLVAAAYVATRLFREFEEVLVPVALAILISAVIIFNGAAVRDWNARVGRAATGLVGRFGRRPRLGVQ